MSKSLRNVLLAASLLLLSSSALNAQDYLEARRNHFYSVPANTGTYYYNPYYYSAPAYYAPPFSDIYPETSYAPPSPAYSNSYYVPNQAPQRYHYYPQPANTYQWRPVYPQQRCP
jgi:hypothetical protein